MRKYLNTNLLNTKPKIFNFFSQFEGKTFGK